MGAGIPTMDDFNSLEKRVMHIEDLLTKISKYLIPGTLTIKDIASQCGMSVGTLYNDKYRHYLPNFGQSDYPDGLKRWNLKTVENWESIPIHERKTMWQNMKKKERELIIAS